MRQIMHSYGCGTPASLILERYKGKCIRLHANANCNSLQVYNENTNTIPLVQKCCNVQNSSQLYQHNIKLISESVWMTAVMQPVSI